MSNLIDRQAAIDVMCELMRHWFGGDPKDEIREIKRELEKLPSAQPVAKDINVPAKDCISRQAAIDEIRRCRFVVDAIEKISKLPSAQPEQRWIPCEERLPEDIKPVIVTWKNTDPKSYYQYIVGKLFIGTAHYKNGKWFWYSSVTEDLLAEYGRCDAEEFDEAIECVAWMPLPEPYEESEPNG